MRILAFAVLFVCSVLRADTLRVFALEGFNTTHGTLTGEIWVYVTTGEGVYANLTYFYYGDYGEYRNQFIQGVQVSGSGALATMGCRDCLTKPDEHSLIFRDPLSGPNQPGLGFIMGVPGSLIDYQGALCWSEKTFGQCSSDNYVYSGFSLWAPPTFIGDHFIPSMYISGVDYFGGQNSLRLVGEFQTPEPATIVLLGSGVVGVVGAARKRRKDRAGLSV